MKLAIIGYGQMGKIVETIALERGHQIIATIDPVNKAAKYSKIDHSSLLNAEVCIDFTHPETVLTNVQAIIREKKNMVLGTTGWQEHFNQIKKLVELNNTGIIYASNFSPGMNIFYRIIQESARLIDKFENYDVSGLELHHNKKADSPSGTAKKLAEILLQNIQRKKKVSFDLVNRKIDPHELHFASLRCGSIPGTHKIIFDSAADTIELTHTARSRQALALGAVIAAEWIQGKKGFYSIDDMMQDKLG
jgi:4-hydroxy-tetrahydrodipicolinate reductase